MIKTLNSTNSRVKEGPSLYEQLLDELDKEQKDNKNLRDEVKELKMQLLTGSIKYENLMRDSNQAALRQKDLIDVLSVYLNEFLDEFEGRFDDDENFTSVEMAIQYLSAAKTQEKRGRTNNRIDAVQSWVDKATGNRGII